MGPRERRRGAGVRDALRARDRQGDVPALRADVRQRLHAGARARRSRRDRAPVPHGPRQGADLRSSADRPDLARARLRAVVRSIGLVVLIVIALVPRAGDAQPAAVPRIGFLGATGAAVDSPQILALRHGLRDLGWVEGQTVAIDYRWADGHPERLPALARELVALKVDVIVTAG